MLLNFEQLKLKHNMTIKGVIHIGAHIGQEYKTYEKHNIKNLMFFEPVPVTFKKLNENLSGKAILVNKALGNNNSKIKMNIETANEGQSSSILKPNLHLKQYPHIQFNETVEVDMVRLDDYFMNENINPEDYNMINIDVQGYELEVFKGSQNILNNISYIISEVNRDEVYENCAKVQDLDVFLKKYGFDRVETTWDGLTWGDALYVKG